MTPDWAAKPTAVPYAMFGDPQSLNLYAYVRNDPISRADADGHDTAMRYIGQTGSYSDSDMGDSNPGDVSTDSEQQARATYGQVYVYGGQAQNQSSSSCEAQMRSRPGDVTSARDGDSYVGASHAWWWVVDSNGQDHTLSFTMNMTLQTVWTPEGPIAVPTPVLNAYAANGPQSSSNKNDNQHSGGIFFDKKGPSTCSGVAKMIEAVKNFPHNQVPYGPVNGTATSNSGARYLGAVGGFDAPKPNQRGLRAVGWDLRIPGVER